MTLNYWTTLCFWTKALLRNSLNVQCVTFGDSEKLHNPPFTHPPSPGVPCELCWRAPTYTSSTFFLVYLRMRALTLNTEHAVWQLDCPHQASIEIWRCRMALWSTHILIYLYGRIFLLVGKPNHIMDCDFILLLLYLWAVCNGFSNIKFINQTKYYTLDL